MMSTSTNDAAAEADMIRYGITRVPTAYYQFREYRYTKLEDAIAQARKHERMALQR